MWRACPNPAKSIALFSLSGDLEIITTPLYPFWPRATICLKPNFEKASKGILSTGDLHS